MSLTHFLLQKAYTGTEWQSDVYVGVDSLGEIVYCATKPELDVNYELIKEPVIPGFINLHSHAFQFAFAGLAESRQHASDSFWTWREMMYRLLEGLTPEDYYVIAKRVYTAMLKAGYTQVGEFHYVHHGPKGVPYSDIAEMSKCCIQAAREVGIRITLMPVLYQRGNFDGTKLSDHQKRFGTSLDTYHKLIASLATEIKTPTESLGLAPHSLRAVDPCLLSEVVGMARDLQQCPIHIHIAEQVAEVEACLAEHQTRPIALLAENVSLDEQWCLVHATHADASELITMAESHLVVGLCPSTEANLGDGLFQANSYFQMQGRFGIGSDSHILLNPWEELRWLEYGQRLILQQRSVLADTHRPHVGKNLYDAVSAGGSRALQTKTGKIAKGYLADWLCLKEEFEERGHFNHWIFASAENPIKRTMVAGKWVTDSFDPETEAADLKKLQAILKRL